MHYLTFVFVFPCSWGQVCKNVVEIEVHEYITHALCRYFVLSDLKSRSLIHFELILSIVLSNYLVTKCFACGCPNFPTQLLKRLLFSMLDGLGTFLLTMCPLCINYVFICIIHMQISSSI